MNSYAFVLFLAVILTSTLIGGLYMVEHFASKVNQIKFEETLQEEQKQQFNHSFEDDITSSASDFEGLNLKQ